MNTATVTPDNVNAAGAVLGGNSWVDQGGMSSDTDTAPPASATPDTSNLPVNTRPAVASPTQVTGPKQSRLSKILHAIGDAVAPETAQRVNSQTGQIEPVRLTTGQRIGNAIGTAVRGAAAGAAQTGPGSVGRAALAGVQAQQQFQQQQTENNLAQSRNVRETNAANQEALVRQANLALMSQAQARNALDMKAFGMELDKNQIALANSLQSVLDMPGVKLLQHFDSNAEINKHLETVGPLMAKKYAIDMTKKAFSSFLMSQTPLLVLRNWAAHCSQHPTCRALPSLNLSQQRSLDTSPEMLY